MRLGIGLYRHMLNDEYFKFASQIGCTDIIVHLANYYSGEIVTSTDSKHNYGKSEVSDPAWTEDFISNLIKKAESYNLNIYGIENFSPSHWHDVLLDGPEREGEMEHLKSIIKIVGKCGIKAFGYNFSIAGVWGHQHKNRARGGAESVSFDASELDIDAPIPNGEVWNMTYDSEAAPGVIAPISREELWRRFRLFLEEILPVAEKAGVEMALHPDDPPMPCMRQTARLVYQPEYYDDVISISSSPSNKLEFCMGSIQEMTHGDIYASIDKYSKENRISYIHFRNVKGKVPCYDEVFVDDGDIDMYRAIKILAGNHFKGLLIPDHTPLITAGGDPWKAGMAYAIGYMKALLDVLRKDGLVNAEE